MNPYAYEKWQPHDSSIRRNLRPWASNDLNQAYQYWEGFESESDHVKNVQKISAGKVLDQIRAIYPEGLGKKQLDLEANWFFISEGIGVFYLHVQYDVEEDYWAVIVDFHLSDLTREHKALRFKTDQEVLDWLQSHPPKSVSESLFDLAAPVAFAYQNFENSMDMEIKL